MLTFVSAKTIAFYNFPAETAQSVCLIAYYGRLSLWTQLLPDGPWSLPVAVLKRPADLYTGVFHLVESYHLDGAEVYLLGALVGSSVTYVYGAKVPSPTWLDPRLDWVACVGGFIKPPRDVTAPWMLAAIDAATQALL